MADTGDGDVGALERNVWGMWRQFGNGPGCSLHDEPELLAYQTPIERVPYNMVLRFRSEHRVDERIAAALEPFRQRGVPVVWLVHPTSEPHDLRDRLREQGFDRAEVLAGMATPIDRLPAAGARPPGVDIEPVSGDTGDLFVGLVSWRYELDPASAAHVAEIMRANRFGEAGSPNHAWVARLDGEPVAKVTLHLSGDVAGIYGLATTPAARGKGLGRLLTLTAYDAARAAGATTAVLHSTPMAVSLYSTLGFRRVADFELWAEPDSLHL